MTLSIEGKWHKKKEKEQKLMEYKKKKNRLDNKLITYHDELCDG